MAADWCEIRGEFPALAEWTYLNTATFGQMPRRAAAAVARHFAKRDELCLLYTSFRTTRSGWRWRNWPAQWLSLKSTAGVEMDAPFKPMLS